MRRLTSVPVWFAIAGLMALALAPNPAMAYPFYRGSPACSSCHPGFIGGFGAPLHDLHNQMTTDCLKCHNTLGDNAPLTKCAGCHVEAGIVTHHTNAGAPPDGNGLFCATCHPGVIPGLESDLPPYYGQPGVSLTSPCETDPLLGGEDYDTDGFGLDNDGDLAYDAADPDCIAAIPTMTEWALIAMVLMLLATGLIVRRRFAAR